MRSEVDKIQDFIAAQASSIQTKEAQTYHVLSIDHLWLVATDLNHVDNQDLRYLSGCLNTICRELERLQRFVVINTTGLRRIIEKLETIQNVQRSKVEYWTLKIDEIGSTWQTQISENLQKNIKVAKKVANSFETADSPGSDTLFLRTFSLDGSLNLSTINDLHYAVKKDDAEALGRSLQISAQSLHDPNNWASALFACFRYSAFCASQRCLTMLMERIQSLDWNEIDSDHILQELRLFAAHLRQVFAHVSMQPQDRNGLIEKLDCQLLPIITMTTLDGRSFLHEAAACGELGLCSLYLKIVRARSQGGAKATCDALIIRDHCNVTPIHLAVVAGSLQVTDLFLSNIKEAQIRDHEIVPAGEIQCLLDELLHIAVASNNLPLVQLLLQHNARPNSRGTNGQSALFLASQRGFEEIVQSFLDATHTSRQLIDLPEILWGWTPLCVAAANGHRRIVQTLISAGADQSALDYFGWTAKENGAFRGHLSLASDIQTKQSNDRPLRCATPRMASSSPIDLHQNECVLITLGSPNIRDAKEPVILDSSPGEWPGPYMLNFRVLSSGTSKSNINSSVVLPVVEDMINKPWLFDVENIDEAMVVFDIMDNMHGRMQHEPIGRAILQLSMLKHSVASRREGLARYYTLPILARDTLRPMGTVTFGLVVVTSHVAPRTVPRSARKGFWKPEGPTQVVGHRGSGANTSARTNLQIGENTIQSYISAVDSGASAVEFDVQLTKDLVPVIFHDFLVMEAGGDTPLYTLRLDQFLQLSNAQKPRGDLSGMAETRFLEKIAGSEKLFSKPRSYSQTDYDDSRRRDLDERMRYTESAMNGDHKGNLRGDSIQGVFPKFEQLFTDLPESIAFNVEMKYPMLWEAEDRNMDIYAPEINTYIDIVLKTIYRLGGKRSITFSSFSPEVCILLSLKQKDYPILFLSKAGSIPVGDIRCSGLQQSIRFARRWNLAGIVILSDPLVMCPRLIGYAKSAGLKVCSYGPLNNKPENAKVSTLAKQTLNILSPNKAMRLTSCPLDTSECWT